MVGGSTPEIPHAPQEQVFIAAQQREMGQAKLAGLEALKAKFLEIYARAQLAFKQVKERITKKKQGDTQALSKPFEGEITNEATENHAVKITRVRVQEAVKAFKEDPKLIPVGEDTTGGKIVREVINRIDSSEINDTTAPFVYAIIQKGVANTVSNPLSVLSPEEFRFFKEINPQLANKVIDAVTSIAKNQGASEADIAAFNTEIAATEPSSETPVPTEATPETTTGGTQDEEENKARDYGSFESRMREPEDRKLVEAFKSPKRFNNYLGELVQKRIEQMGVDDYDKLTEPQQKKIGREISKELSEKVTLLMGKLFRKVDESSPKDFWEEAAKKGSVFDNTDMAAEAFLQQLDNLKNETYDSNSWTKRLKFFKRKEIGGDRIVEAKEPYSKEGEGKTSEATRQFISPFYNNEEVEFRDYLFTVYNGAEDEIQTRKFFHNSTALMHQPPPPEGGIWAKMAGYAKTQMTSSGIDVMSKLPDADAVYSASQLEDKLLEAEFAKLNWIYSQTMSQLDPETQMTKRGKDTLQYLRQLYPDLKKDDWRYKRALIMGIGDNHSIALKTIEHGARADAPRNIHDGTCDYSSYDKQDMMPFMALNPFNHFNLRYGLDSTLMGNLLFLPVEGEGVGKMTAFWNHNNLMNEMKQTMKSFVTGRDDDKKTLMIDYTNLGGAGSIYTRSNWRNYHAYEGFLDRTSDNKVLNTWKNIETIGIETLKDLVDKRIGELDGDFYKNAGTTKRQEMVDYLYKRYFKKGDVIPDTAEVADKFKELEKNQGEKELSKKYKEFYYQTMTRAIRQRIPTKFLRYEKNREVVKRERAWEVVWKKFHLARPEYNRDAYEQAVKDLCAVEVKERQMATKKLNGVIDGMKDDEENLKLDSVHTIYQHEPVEYELNEKKIEEYLLGMRDADGEEKMSPDRVENALEVYRQTMIFTEETETDGTGRLDKFAKNYEKGKMPYALAVEELERTFLSQRGAGEQAPSRALADIGFTEEKTCKVFANYFEKLKDVAINGKHDFSELVHDIEVSKQQLTIDIDPEHAKKIAHHMSALTISFFKRDTIARNWLTYPLTQGRKNSLAAEFTGTRRGAWEWDVREVDAFVSALEGRGVLPKEPFTPGKPPTSEDKEIRIPLPILNKIPFKFKVRKLDEEWYGGKLRKEFGADKAHILFEIAGKYLPWVAVFVLWQYIQKALKETEGKE